MIFQSRPTWPSSVESSRTSPFLSLLSMASIITLASKSSGGHISRSSFRRGRSVEA